MRADAGGESPAAVAPAGSSGVPALAAACASAPAVGSGVPALVRGVESGRASVPALVASGAPASVVGSGRAFRFVVESALVLAVESGAALVPSLTAPCAPVSAVGLGGPVLTAERAPGLVGVLGRARLLVVGSGAPT